ncbi:hypothetical protein [Caulobacter sp. Root1472]|uniref:hypothetical protein n=1 Tax=Caulobacter sp. Root1472 TaxID=1736470 RepID=UPI0006FA40E5|nr:hypothetical protein [Caulobacter sp. Root1472]KQZ29378.1 hypothetical protein ASD47_19145 [Caulobacter sp. Root1472]
MENKPERPNTVAGLLEKRAQLAGIIKFHRAELRKVICDLDHIDATIRMFDAKADINRVARYPTKHRATKGQASVFVLRMLKAADRPLTSLEIVQAQIKARGLKADEETIVLMRKRVGATLTAQQSLGFVRSIPMEGRYKGWELVR